ncbi:MAG TPA: hypothetical protein VNG33_12840 [Polyangiaceae bacterium]|nr:hypothetical protein [Polyangiaceae bacterium]
MKTGKGIVGISLALSALLVSSANTKTAEARSSALALATREGAHAATASVVAPEAGTSADEASATELTLGAAPLTGELVTPPRLLENPKLRRMQKAEISPALQLAAAQIVRKHHAKPVGTQVEVEVEGRHVYARIERHFHPEGGALKPWGFHPGVSLFCER